MEKYYNIKDVPYERKSVERILTGFSDLDYDIKGLEVGVTLLVANTNSGKSTFCQGILARAVEQGYKVWTFAGEHTAQSFLQLIYHQNSQKKDYQPIGYRNYKGEETNIVDWYVTEEREKKIRQRFDNNIFIYSIRNHFEFLLSFLLIYIYILPQKSSFINQNTTFQQNT